MELSYANEVKQMMGIKRQIERHTKSIAYLMTANYKDEAAKKRALSTAVNLKQQISDLRAIVG